MPAGTPMAVVSLLFHDVYAVAASESGFCSAAADRYKLTVAEFEQQLEGVRPIGPCIRPEAAALRASHDGRAFAITVDDGGVSYFTRIADALEARGWRGACFVTTGLIGAPGFLSAAQIRELDDRGHVIGSHSVSHPARFSACTPTQMQQEWQSSRHRLEDVLGHRVSAASLPGGYFSTLAARTAAEAGYDVLFNSEPSTTPQSIDGCVIAGRFAIRRGCRSDCSRNLVRGRCARMAAWAEWNAKGLLKPVLGSSYIRLAGWLSTCKVSRQMP
jgi:peptidoglycan/xylan/chitin deacetylase (PgdA/CDA1 family)